jgi:hypothetical protein
MPLSEGILQCEPGERLVIALRDRRLGDAPVERRVGSDAVQRDEVRRNLAAQCCQQAVTEFLELQQAVNLPGQPQGPGLDSGQLSTVYAPY